MASGTDRATPSPARQRRSSLEWQVGGTSARILLWSWLTSNSISTSKGFFPCRLPLARMLLSTAWARAPFSVPSPVLARHDQPTQSAARQHYWSHPNRTIKKGEQVWPFPTQMLSQPAVSRILISSIPKTIQLRCRPSGRSPSTNHGTRSSASDSGSASPSLFPRWLSLEVRSRLPPESTPLSCRGSDEPDVR